MASEGNWKITEQVVGRGIQVGEEKCFRGKGKWRNEGKKSFRERW